jgi:hypothetical protein
MAGYNGRRPPGFSQQYLHELNTIPSAYDQALQQQDDSFNIDAELALFTNAEFLDFDNFGDISLPFTIDSAEDAPRQRDAGDKDLGVNYLDFLDCKESMRFCACYVAPTKLSSHLIFIALVSTDRFPVMG